MSKDEKCEIPSSSKSEQSSLVNKKGMDKRTDVSTYGSVLETEIVADVNSGNESKDAASEGDVDKVKKFSTKSPSDIKDQKPVKSKANPGFINLYFDSGSEKCNSEDEANRPSTEEKKQTSDPSNLPGTSQQNKLAIPLADEKDKLSVSETSRDYCPSPSPGDTLPLLLDDSENESSFRIIGEIIVPFLLAGLGCVLAGVILDLVQVICLFNTDYFSRFTRSLLISY